jgi:nitroreductase
MEILRAVQERKSIRSFQSNLVPKALLTDILQAALRSPSSINTQPWECWVVEGETTKQLAEEMYQEGKSGGGFVLSFILLSIGKKPTWIGCVKMEDGFGQF